MLVYSYPFTVIADETDEAAHAKFEQYNQCGGSSIDEKPERQGRKGWQIPHCSENGQHGAKVQFQHEHIDRVVCKCGCHAAKEPIKGVMLTFDDFVKGVVVFGTKI
jgi:pyrimidine oxygenase